MSAANSEIDVWIDGVAKPEMSQCRRRAGGTQVDFVFPTIRIARGSGGGCRPESDTTGTYEVWLDDIAIGNDRLGCE